MFHRGRSEILVALVAEGFGLALDIYLTRLLLLDIERSIFGVEVVALSEVGLRRGVLVELLERVDSLAEFLEGLVAHTFAEVFLGKAEEIAFHYNMNFMEQIIQPKRRNLDHYSRNFTRILQKFQTKSFVLKTFDDVQLPATLYFQPKFTRTIIYLHSYCSCQEEGLSLLEFCAEYECNLITYDQRGNGRGSPSYIYFGFREKTDLLYIIFYTTNKFNLNEFFLWGRSMGCNAIIQLCASLDERLDLAFRDKTNEQRGGRKAFLSQELKLFSDKNAMEEAKCCNFSIESIILDSPYSSLDSFVKNLIKSKARILGFLDNVVGKMLSNYLDKKLGFEQSQIQN